MKPRGTYIRWSGNHSRIVCTTPGGILVMWRIDGPLHLIEMERRGNPSLDGNQLRLIGEWVADCSMRTNGQERKDVRR